jgi:hypothetical protein
MCETVEENGKKTLCMATFISNKSAMFFFLYFFFCKIGEQENRIGAVQGPVRGGVCGRERR